MKVVERWIFMGFGVCILLLFMAKLQFYIHTSLPNASSCMNLFKVTPFNPTYISKDSYTNPYKFSNRILSGLSHGVNKNSTLVKNITKLIQKATKIEHEIVQNQSKVHRVCDPEVEGWPPQKLKNFGERYLHPNKNASLLLPSFVSKPIEKKLSLICIVKSRVDGFEQRRAVRNTWMTFTKELPMTVIFIVGNPNFGSNESKSIVSRLQNESQVYGDILQEDFLDTYHNLTVKVMFALKFAHNYLTPGTSKWVVMADDDTYLNLPVLWKHINSYGAYKPMTIVGKELGPDELPHRTNCTKDGPKFTQHKWHMPYYMYGKLKYPNFVAGVAYYLPLGGNTTSCLYREGSNLDYVFLDDLFITGIAREKCGLHIANAEKIYPLACYDKNNFCKNNFCFANRDLDIAVHYVKGLRAMEDLHSVILGQASCKSRYKFQIKLGKTVQIPILRA